MSFVLNNADKEQITLFDSLYGLTKREQRFLDRSWAKYFAEHIFPAIDEKPFGVLYSSKASRPNTPVNVLVGSSILQQLTNQSDEEFLESLLFDVRYQYALHTTGFQEQPLSDRSLGRFRSKCHTYFVETGTDLMKNAVLSVTEEMSKLMQIDHSLKRMDSMMVASSIKRMSRLELLYTCVASLVRKMESDGMEIPPKLHHYIEADDRNLVIYHNHSDESATKIEVILLDAEKILPLCKEALEESSEYQLLIRVLREQTVEDGEGSRRLRTKEDGGMNSEILQNPADPEATYRDKAGKEYRGYTANIVEEKNADGDSLITDFQLENNTYSDSQFAKDVIEKLPSNKEESTTIVADGAFTCKDRELLKEKNAELINTNLTGREAPDINADFEFNEEGTRVTKCPGGYAPKSCSYSPKTEQCAVSFHKHNCEQCPYREQCKPKEFNRTCRKYISAKSRQRALQQRERKSEEFKKISAFRNGVETVPSILRRKYHVDHMPVRGKSRMGFLFGCKIAAVNFKKFCVFMLSQDNCAQNAVIA